MFFCRMVLFIAKLIIVFKSKIVEISADAYKLIAAAN